MRAKCGACETVMDIPGAGRFQCPSCGQLNEVRSTEPTGASEPIRPAGISGFAPPPTEQRAPRTECPSCGFHFIVGVVDTAICPNCQAEVAVGPGEVPEGPESDA